MRSGSHDWARLSRFPEHAHEFGRRAFRAYFGEGVDMTSPANVAAIGAALGVPADELEAGLASQPMKDRVKQHTDEAISKGVFGSPFLIVDGEPFWGWDRMPMLERWLETGGW